jgi:hypothetical protein
MYAPKLLLRGFASWNGSDLDGGAFERRAGCYQPFWAFGVILGAPVQIERRVVDHRERERLHPTKSTTFFLLAHVSTILVPIGPKGLSFWVSPCSFSAAWNEP